MHESHMSLVRRMFEEFTGAGTAELLLAHLTADAVYRTTAPAGTALDERFVGPAGVREYFRRAGELLQVDEVRVTDYFESGERIVVLGTERLALVGSAETSTHDWATVVTFRGPAIAEVCVLEDLSLLKQV